MFLPESSDAAEFALAAAQLPWFLATLPVVTHIFAVPLLWLSLIKLRWYLFGGVFLYGIPVSIAYHLCQAWESTCLGVPLAIYLQHDHIWATLALVVNAMALMRFYAHRWASLVLLANFSVIVFVSLVNPGSFLVQLVALHLQLMSLFFKAVVIDSLYSDPATRLRIVLDVLYRFERRYLGIGTAFIVVGLGSFMFDSPPYYWITHSLWHVFIYIGSFFVLLGVSEDIDTTDPEGPPRAADKLAADDAFRLPRQGISVTQTYNTPLL